MTLREGDKVRILRNLEALDREGGDTVGITGRMKAAEGSIQKISRVYGGRFVLEGFTECWSSRLVEKVSPSSRTQKRESLSSPLSEDKTPSLYVLYISGSCRAVACSSCPLERGTCDHGQKRRNIRKLLRRYHLPVPNFIEKAVVRPGEGWASPMREFGIGTFETQLLSSGVSFRIMNSQGTWKNIPLFGPNKKLTLRKAEWWYRLLVKLRILHPRVRPLDTFDYETCSEERIVSKLLKS